MEIEIKPKFSTYEPKMPKIVFEKTKKQSKKLSFIQCLQPVYILGRLFGFLPFQVHFDSNGQIDKATVGVCDFIWFVTSIAINLVFAYLMIFPLGPIIGYGSPVLIFCVQLFSILGFIIAALAISLDMWNRKCLVKTFKKFTEFDRYVRIKQHKFIIY